MDTDAFEGSVVHLLHQATQVADGAFIRAVRTLTPRQFVILKAVAASEGLSQTDLVLATGIDRSTVSSMTRTLIVRGYLSRKRNDEDTRAFRLRLTKSGRRVLDGARPTAEKVGLTLLGSLCPPERERFLKLLAAFARKNL